MIWCIVTVISLVMAIPSSVTLVSIIIIASLISQGGAAGHPEDNGHDGSQHVREFDMPVHNSLLQFPVTWMINVMVP
jgi:hypothetical protein